nr:hypothetical protein [Morchella crassipes]
MHDQALPPLPNPAPVSLWNNPGRVLHTLPPPPPPACRPACRGWWSRPRLDCSVTQTKAAKPGRSCRLCMHLHADQGLCKVGNMHAHPMDTAVLDRNRSPRSLPYFFNPLPSVHFRPSPPPYTTTLVMGGWKWMRGSPAASPPHTDPIFPEIRENMGCGEGA